MEPHDVIRHCVDIAVRVIAHARADCWATAVAIGGTYPNGGDPWLGNAVAQFCDQARHAPDIGDPAAVVVPTFDGQIDREGLDALMARLDDLRALIPPAAVALVVAPVAQPDTAGWSDMWGDEVPRRGAEEPQRPTRRPRRAGAAVLVGAIVAAIASAGVITAAWRANDDGPSAADTAGSTAGTAELARASATSPTTSVVDTASTASTTATAAATTTEPATTVADTTTVPLTTVPATPVPVATTAAPAPPTTRRPTPTTPATQPPAPTTPPPPPAPGLSAQPYFSALGSFSPAGATAMMAQSVERGPAWAYGRHLQLGFEADPGVARAAVSLRDLPDGSLQWCITGKCRILRDFTFAPDGRVDSFTVDGSPLVDDVRAWLGDGPLLCIGGSGSCTEPTAVAVRLAAVFSVGTSTFVDIEVTVGADHQGVVAPGSATAVVDGVARPSRAGVARQVGPGQRTVWLYRFDRFAARAPLQIDLGVTAGGAPTLWQLPDR